MNITPPNFSLLQRLLVAFTFVTTLLLAMSPPAHAIEEPTYSVVQKTDVFEVRQYAPYFVAEVVVDRKSVV